MPKILCPQCGTTNTPRFNPLARCKQCRMRLPFRTPRAWAYALRTIWRPLVFLVLLGGVISLTPIYKNLRESQQFKTHFRP
ncbi:MAG: hypothetical protein EON60_04565 [Alphaproteobacteria bacterium]|nr:MAG: hypothetical protein EON60_04565 [Alphaproteobacteria bacterium]